MTPFHTRSPRAGRQRLATVLIAALACSVAHAAGERPAEPPRGSKAPPIELNDLHGIRVSSAQMPDRVLIIVFGELDNAGTLRACGQVLEAVKEPRLEGAAITPMLVVAHAEPAAALPEPARAQLPRLVLHDPDRTAFGAYRIVVVPTIVVVEAHGTVVHSMPGFAPRFQQILSDALATAIGLQTVAAFESSLRPADAPPADPVGLRADRLVHLGDELAGHGLVELAQARYEEAIRIRPGHSGALLGLASLQRAQGRLQEAESLYRSVLATAPEDARARLGLAAVQLGRGGEAIEQAEASVREVLKTDANSATAHFLLGQVHEQRGQFRDAAAEYRRAAELLLNTK